MGGPGLFGSTTSVATSITYESWRLWMALKRARCTGHLRSKLHGRLVACLDVHKSRAGIHWCPDGFDDALITWVAEEAWMETLLREPITTVNFFTRSARSVGRRSRATNCGILCVRASGARTAHHDRKTPRPVSAKGGERRWISVCPARPT